MRKITEEIAISFFNEMNKKKKDKQVVYDPETNETTLLMYGKVYATKKNCEIILECDKFSNTVKRMLNGILARFKYRLFCKNFQDFIDLGDRGKVAWDGSKFDIVSKEFVDVPNDFASLRESIDSKNWQLAYKICWNMNDIVATDYLAEHSKKP